MRELGQWTPSRWKAGKRRLYALHLKKHCWRALCELMGSYNAGLLMAEINRDADEIKSVEQLSALGVKTIGEQNILDLMREARK
jgi:hypothetical protein